jgi:hypothetical protein
MSVPIDRRSFIAGGGGALAAGILLPLVAGGSAPAWADSVPITESELPVRWLTELDSLSCLTYPHANSFFDGGAHLVIRWSLFPGTDPNLLHIVNLATGARTVLPERSPGRPMLSGYFDVHYPTGKLIIPESQAQANIDGTGIKIFTFDLAEYLATGTGAWEVVYELPVGKLVADSMVAWHPDGTKYAFSMMGDTVVGGELPTDRYCDLIEVELATGVSRVRVSDNKLHNHVHYHPAFPNWLMFAREGAPTLQRIWSHHDTFLPTGGPVVPQVFNGTTLSTVGHERASFSDSSTTFVSWDNPRSVWRGHVDYSAPVKIANGRFEHCDVSRDGRFIVCDTADPIQVGGGGHRPHRHAERQPGHPAYERPVARRRASAPPAPDLLARRPSRAVQLAGCGRPQRGADAHRRGRHQLDLGAPSRSEDRMSARLLGPVAGRAGTLEQALRRVPRSTPPEQHRRRSDRRCATKTRKAPTALPPSGEPSASLNCSLPVRAAFA